MKSLHTNTIWIFLILHLYICTLNKVVTSETCSPYNEDNEDADSFETFMKELDEFTFTPHTIDIRNCSDVENNSQYTYVLDTRVVWIKRFEIYDENYENLITCRDCNVTSDFQTCMQSVRNNMLSTLQTKTEELETILQEIKTEIETDCNMT